MKTTVTVLVFCVAALLALGLVILYSESMTHGARFLVKQLQWCALGIAACVVAACIKPEWLRRWAWLFYGLAVILLAAVLVPHVGMRINGARRWLGFGGVVLQPSEFAKLALIIFLAWYGARFQRQMETFKLGLAVPLLLVAVVLGLVFKEPDVGTTILIAAVAASMLVVAGVRVRFIVPPGLAAALGLGLYLWQDPVRLRRILAWLFLEENKEGVGYQAYQAMLALGSGGLTGLGLGDGRQKRGFVPEQHTDFIFAIIGEELGLVATLLVVLAFLVIVLCGLRIALRTEDRFGLLLATGVSLLIGLQAFINIGVVTSVLPNKGIPLPFISYGGSNLLVMLTCVGLLINLARRARTPEPRPENPFETGPVALPQYS